MYAMPTTAAAAVTGVAIGTDKIIKHYEKKHQSKKWYGVVQNICKMIERAGLGAIISKFGWPLKGIVMATGGVIGGTALYKATKLKNIEKTQINPEKQEEMQENSDPQKQDRPEKITGIIKKKLNDRDFLNSLAIESLSISGIALSSTVAQALPSVLSGISELKDGVPLSEVVNMSR